jgi:hypothetical protein
MRKVWGLLLVGLLGFSLVGCSSQGVPPQVSGSHWGLVVPLDAGENALVASVVFDSADWVFVTSEGLGEGVLTQFRVFGGGVRVGGVVLGDWGGGDFVRLVFRRLRDSAVLPVVSVEVSDAVRSRVLPAREFGLVRLPGWSPPLVDLASVGVDVGVLEESLVGLSSVSIPVSFGVPFDVSFVENAFGSVTGFGLSGRALSFPDVVTVSSAVGGSVDFVNFFVGDGLSAAQRAYRLFHADLNGNGVVNAFDVILGLRKYVDACSGGQVVGVDDCGLLASELVVVPQVFDAGSACVLEGGVRSCSALVVNAGNVPFGGSPVVSGFPGSLVVGSFGHVVSFGFPRLFVSSLGVSVSGVGSRVLGVNFAGVAGVSVFPSVPQVLPVGSSLSLSAVASVVGGVDGGVVWSSSDVGVVSVSSGGVVSGVGAGSAVVRAVSVADEGVFGEVSVLVPSVVVGGDYAGVSGVVGVGLSVAPSGVSGGFGGLAFELVSGALPGGLVLSAASGLISGVPLEAGSFSGVVRVSDSSSPRQSRDLGFSFVISGVSQLVVGNYPVTVALVGDAVSVSPVVSGGFGSLLFVLESGSLPVGVSLDAGSGVLSGTVTQVGSFAGVVRVSDEAGQFGSAPFLLVFSGVPGSVVASNYVSVSVEAGGVVLMPPVVSGGVSPLSFSLVSGSLPDGVLLDPVSGVIGGVPTVAGQFSGVVLVADAVGVSVAVSFVLNVSQVIPPLSALPYGSFVFVVGDEVLVVPRGVAGGLGSWSFELVDGVLPGGVSLNAASGVLSGVASEVGSFVGSVRVSDEASNFVVVSFSVVVSSVVEPLVFGGYEAVSVVRGVEFSVSPLGVSGGVSPLSFGVVSGSLPDGVSLNGVSGVVSGSALVVGSFAAVVSVVDAVGSSVPVSLLVSVVSDAARLSVEPYEFSSVAVGVSVSVAPGLVSGGDAPYVFSLVSGSLPGGVALNGASGVISGVPTVAGSFSGGVLVEDASGQSAVIGFSLLVSPAVTPVVVGDYVGVRVLVGESVNMPVVGLSGGVGPYSFEVAAGSLPSGVSLNVSSGLLFGVVSEVGSFSGAVLVRDSLGQVAVSAFSLVVFADVPGLLVLPYVGSSVLAGEVFAFEPVVVSGGSGGLVFSLVAGSLPSGVTLNASSGVIGGSTSVLGSVAVAVAVVDSSGQRVVVSAAFTVGELVGGLVFGPYLPVSGRVGELLAIAAGVVSGGVSPYAFSLVSGALPEGVSLSAVSGAISGTPSVAGSFDGVVRVTDAVGNVAFSAFAFLVNSDVAPLVVLPYTSTSRLLGSSVSIAANVSSFGALPLAFELVDGALPSGVSLNSVSGLISGVPSVAGSFSGAVRVSDAVGQSATATFLLTVSEDVTVLLADPYATVTRVLGQVLSLDSVNVRGGVTPYVFSLSSGALPAGVTVGSAGVISGVPSEVGLFSGLVRVEDAAGQVAFAPFFVSVVSDAEPISWLPYSDATVLEGGSLSVSPSLSGGEAPFEFSLAAGSLPAGVSLDAVSGVISGVPSVSGLFSGAVRVVDAVGQRSSASFRVLVTPDVTPVAFGGYGFVSLSLGESASLLPLSVSGGVSPYEFSLVGGALPVGLSLASGGLISGVPSELGSWSGVIRVTDSVGQVASAAFAFVVNPVFDALVASPYANVVTVVGSSVSMSPVGVSGGFGDLVFGVVAGALPAGLSLDAVSGVISGAASVEGSFSGAVAVVDEVGSRVTVTFSIVVTPDVTPLVPVAYASVMAVAGEELSVSSGVSGGLTPYEFVLLSGALPDGVSLDGVSGVISGVPSVAGSFAGSVRVEDALGQSVGVTFSIVVSTSASPLVGGAYAPVSVLVGEPVVITPSSVSGGVSPYAFVVSSGELPSGLSLNAVSGVVSGTPSVVGSFAAVVSVSDGVGQLRSSALAISVVEPVVPLLVDAYAFESVVLGSGLSVSPVVVSGGAGDLVFALESGALPGGVTLSASSGVLAGVTSEVGVFSGVVRVTDARSVAALASFRLTVRPPELVFGAYADSVVVEGVEFSVSPGSVSGGAAPLAFSLVGSLPAGVSLDAGSGVISGVPTELGVFGGLVRVSDSFGLSASAAYLVDVRSSAGALLLSPYPFTSALVGSSVSVSPVGLSGGAPELVFEVVSGSLPAGVSLNAASGVLSGVPSVAGSFAGVVSVSDAVGQRVLVTFSLVVSEDVPALVGVSYEAVTLVEGQVASVAGPSVSGGLSPYSFVLSSGALPSGVSLSVSSGVLSGTPSVTGVFSGVITVSDAAGQSVPLSFALTVVPDVEPLLVLPYGTVSQVEGTVLNLGASVSGGRAPFVFSRLSGELPGGVSLNASSGALVGSLSGTGSFSGVVGVVDSVGQSATASFSIVVTPDVTPVVMSDYEPEEFLDGALVSFSAVGVSGGVPPYAFEVVSGSLPSGLVLGGSTGSISGTAGEVGSFAGVVRVTDAVGQSALGAFSLVVLSSADPLVVLPYSPVSVLVGGSVSVSPGSVSGGSGGLSFAVVGGALPAGVSLNASTGLISGTPSTAGSFVGAVRVVDSVGQRVVVTFSLTVSAVVPELVMSNYAPSTVLANVAFSASPVGLSGGVTPYSFSVVSGALPSGLSLGSGGVISGTPSAEGTFAAVVIVSDASGQSVPVSFGVTVLPNVTALVVSPYASSSVTVGDVVSLAANVSGGRAPYSFSVVSGSLGGGSMVATGGTITDVGGYRIHTFTSPGSFVVSDVGATGEVEYLIVAGGGAGGRGDDGGAAAGAGGGGVIPGSLTVTAQAYSITVGAGGAGSSVNLTPGNNGNNSSAFGLTAVGGGGSGAGSNGRAIGRPGASGGSGGGASVTVNQDFWDALGGEGTGGQGNRGGNAVAINLSGVARAAAGGGGAGGPAADVTNVAGSGGPGLTSSISGTAVTYGVGGDGRITSGPGAAGTDGRGNGGGGGVGAASGKGGDGIVIIRYRLSTPLSLNAETGEISGVASSVGTLSGTVLVTDALGSTSTSGFVIEVQPEILSVSNYVSLSRNVETTPGSVTINAPMISGGSAPYSYSLINRTDASFPNADWVLNSNGSLSGTLSVVGSWVGSVLVRDASGQSAVANYSISGTKSSSFVVSDYPRSSYSVGDVVSNLAPSSFSGAVGSVSSVLLSGSLPPGVSLGSGANARFLSGTVTTAGTYSGVVRFSDSIGQVALASFSIQVIVPLSASNYVTTTVTLGSGVSLSPVNVSGGSGARSFALASGALPSGVSLSSSTGVISGTPTVTGTFGGVVAVVDSLDTTVNVSFALSVTPPEIFALPYGSAVGEVDFALSVSPGAVSAAVAPLSYVLSSGSLPTGVSVNASTGVISGTPTSAGTFVGYVRVTDSRGSVAQMRFDFPVSTARPSLAFSSYGTIATNPGVTVRKGPAISGGLAPYSFEITSGSLPSGIELNASTGFIEGRTYTTTSGVSRTIRVTDAVGRTTTASVTVSSVVDLSKQIGVIQATGGSSAFINLPRDAEPGDILIVFFGSLGARTLSTPSGCTNYFGQATANAGTTSTGVYLRGFGCDVTATAINSGGYSFGTGTHNWAAIAYHLKGGTGYTGGVGDCEFFLSPATSTSTISQLAANSISATRGFSFNFYVVNNVNAFSLGAGTAGRVLHQVQNDGVGWDTSVTTTVSLASAYVRRTGAVNTGTQTMNFSPSSTRSVAVSGYCLTLW